MFSDEVSGAVQRAAIDTHVIDGLGLPEMMCAAFSLHLETNM